MRTRPRRLALRLVLRLALMLQLRLRLRLVLLSLGLTLGLSLSLAQPAPSPSWRRRLQQEKQQAKQQRQRHPSQRLRQRSRASATAEAETKARCRRRDGERLDESERVISLLSPFRLKSNNAHRSNTQKDRQTGRERACRVASVKAQGLGARPGGLRARQAWPREWWTTARRFDLFLTSERKFDFVKKHCS